MALSILDGNQSATTLSTILSSGQHITAHTVVSLGTQAITDIVNATSAGLTNTQLRASAVTIGGTVTVGGFSSVSIGSGALLAGGLRSGSVEPLSLDLPTGYLLVKVDSALPAGTNRIGVVTIGGGTVTIGAGTSQIGSVTASISNSLTISSLPAISGTVTANGGDFSSLNNAQPASKIQIGFLNQGGDFVAVNEDGYPFPANLFVDGTRVQNANPLPISGTVTANTFAVQGTAVTTSNFTSITASTVLANFNATREVLTIFNEGAGNLHICAGATCTTIAYQVRLSAGDYYEVPNHQTSLTHSAVFATAGTARVAEVS